MHTAEQLKAVLAGRYEVEREIGHGGMATVYLARDIKHNRAVALKVLSSELAAVLGRERFLSEIQVTANLHHPHLLPLFDSGEIDGMLFYAMPYIEGETLRMKLERERQLTIDEAVRIATAVGSALHYAHRHGVIHRDLKPENILLHEGEPLVMDFGIALAVSNAGGARVTQAGISLGTPQYMSPEQATGDRKIDARSDIYSLGAVTYEMLAGEPPHVGPSVQAIMAKVVSDRPRHLQQLRDTVPDHIDNAVLRALAKLPADRWTTAAEFVDAIAGPKALASRANASVATYTGVVKQLPVVADIPPLVTRRTIGWATAAAILCALAGAIGAVAFTTRVEEPQARFVIELPDSLSFGNAHAPQVALSRDGSRAVFFFENNTPGPLYTRRTGELQLDVIPGSDSAFGAIISPNGKEVAYWIYDGGSGTTGQLMKIPITGGVPVKVADSATAPGQASWGDNEQILFRRGDRLVQVSAGGGPVRDVAIGDSAHRQGGLGWPEMLPGSKAALITILHGRAEDPDSLFLGVVTLGDGKVEELGIRGITPRYASGHLLYVRQDGQLFARPFDVVKRKPTGEERVIAKDVMLRSTGQNNIGFQRGQSDLAVSHNGMILFTDGGRAFTNGIGLRRSIVIQRHGAAEEYLPVPQGGYDEVRASPDGSKLALTIRDSANTSHSDVWLLTFSSGQLKRFTRDGKSSHPVWSGDGKRIIYRVTESAGRPTTRFFSAAWDESDTPKVIVGLDNAESVEFPSPGGTYIAIVRGDSSGAENAFANSDIFIAPVDSPAAARPFAATGIRERLPRFSPDGRWLAYVGFELPSTSGSANVGSSKLYLRAVPGPGAVTMVSLEDGSQPLWARDGHALSYFAGGRGAPMVSAHIADGRGVETPARPELITRRAPGTGFSSPVATWTTDMLPDGRVVYVTSQAPPQTPTPGSGNGQQVTAAPVIASKLIAIVNWLAAERAPLQPR